MTSSRLIPGQNCLRPRSDLPFRDPLRCMNFAEYDRPNFLLHRTGFVFQLRVRYRLNHFRDHSLDGQALYDDRKDDDAIGDGEN